MNYTEALFEVNKRQRFGSDRCIDRMERLMAKLGNPQKSLKFIHVAGTNGKGTTCTYVSSILRESGLRVGLYTSPYVVDFRERFQINGEMITEEDFVKTVEELKPIAEEVEVLGDNITIFEFITAVALKWFADMQCDIVVLEVGIGGRLDATNVIDCPEMAVVASISLDHTAVLGDTLEKVATEKAGIVKSGGKVMLYPDQKPQVKEVFSEICSKKNAELLTPEMNSLTIKKSNLYGTDFIYKHEFYHINFTGDHQVLNAITAIESIKNLSSFNIDEENIKRGLDKAFIPARMEIISRSPLFIIDGGHNPGCSKALKEVIDKNLKGKKITGIIGMMSDKDSHSYLADIAPYFHRIITVKPNVPKAMDTESLRLIAKEFCSDVISAKDNHEAIKFAIEDEVIIACGSFFVASEIRRIMLENSEKS